MFRKCYSGNTWFWISFNILNMNHGMNYAAWVSGIAGFYIFSE